MGNSLKRGIINQQIDSFQMILTENSVHLYISLNLEKYKTVLFEPFTYPDLISISTTHLPMKLKILQLCFLSSYPHYFYFSNFVLISRSCSSRRVNV